MREPALHVDLGELAAGPQFRHQAGRHHVHGDPAGDLARAVAAHAVGQHGEPGVAVDEHRVLVVRAHHARMREAGDVEGEAIGHVSGGEAMEREAQRGQGVERASEAGGGSARMPTATCGRLKARRGSCPRAPRCRAFASSATGRAR